MTSTVNAEYLRERSELINAEKIKHVGFNLTLNENEEKVNEILMGYKLKEIDDGLQDPANFLPAQHFFKAKEGIDNSEVFKFIQKLPKGSSLHSHDTAIVEESYLYSLTFEDNLYATTIDGWFMLKFFKESDVNKSQNWTLVKDLRVQDPNFEILLKSKLTLICDNPEKKYPDINTVWNVFMEKFIATEGLVCYKPIFKKYFYQALKELYEDNVMYLEFRGLLPEVYDLEGKTYGPIEVMGLYVETIEEFKKDYPNFHGVRFIYSPLRCVETEVVDSYIETLKQLQKVYPNYIAGFDLVGQEDKGKPLSDFLPKLLTIKDQTKFFFHAGETNCHGAATDHNLVDAVLLNTERIGHGFAIVKHPEVMNLIKHKNIAVEICPISNQVLKLVDDMRNHPGAILIANGLPVVICCDDPSFWGAKGLSHDWYMAFMGMTARETDLRFLKQIAINSIQYTSMDESEKLDALKKWNISWDKFINEYLQV